jgi:hypothetical protein
MDIRVHLGGVRGDFREREKQEVFLAASMDGSTAVREIPPNPALSVVLQDLPAASSASPQTVAAVSASACRPSRAAAAVRALP